MDDPRVAVEVALLDRDAFAGPKAGGGGDDDHRPVDGTELLGDRVDLRPCLERALLRMLSPRIVDAGLGRVGVDDLPGDRAVEELA